MKTEKNINKQHIRTFWKELDYWRLDNGSYFPWREYKDPFIILISEILLQKTAAAPVANVFKNFINIYPTVNSLASSNSNEVAKIISQLGLPKRSKWVVDTAKIIIRDYDGEVPKERGELLSLPGVGNYTADAVLCFAYNFPVIPLDTNTVRIGERIFGIKSTYSRPRRDPHFAQTFSSYLPKNNSREYVYALIDFARDCCRAKQQTCTKCFWQKKCISKSS